MELGGLVKSRLYWLSFELGFSGGVARSGFWFDLVGLQVKFLDFREGFLTLRRTLDWVLDEIRHRSRFEKLLLLLRRCRWGFHGQPLPFLG